MDISIVQRNAYEVLAEAVDAGNVPAKDLGFITSLVGQYRNKGYLSISQWGWVVKMADRITGKPKPAGSVGDYSKVFALLSKAASKLAYPKVTVTTTQGRTVVVYVTGKRSRHPGALAVTSDGGYRNNTFYGWVLADGVMMYASDPGTDEMKDVLALLVEFGNDPEGVASRHGKLTGCCSFCHKALTDDRSIEVGYGPVCATHYGLSWGSKLRKGKS